MTDLADDWSQWVGGQLDGIRSAGRWRRTRSFDALGPGGDLEGRRVVSFASNDYLGLSAHPRVIEAAHSAIDRWGAGATASRLIVGTRPCHDDLEHEIAHWKGTERAIVFPSGFAANLGVLSAIGGRGVTIFSDELNHASIVDGCRLSRSDVVVYRHGDLDQLEQHLDSTAGRRVVVTDSVFSMDGDVVALADLAELCCRHRALLVLDEAHAVLGPHLPTGLDDLAVVRVGTLSKTLGSLGGWVAGSADIIDLLVNRARSYIFTTALTPADAAAGLAGLRVVQSDEGAALVQRLRDVVDRFSEGHPSPIIPVVLGDEARAVACSAALLERGILVPAIRPPTVPPGTSRLRITLSAGHDDAMLTLLDDELRALNLR